MFKLKSNNSMFIKHIEQTYLIYSHDPYDYVITDSPELIEQDKINIVFTDDNIKKAEELLNLIVSGMKVFLNLKNEIGIKKVDVRDIEYFEALENDVYAVVGKERFTCEEKLYELEELLSNKHYARTSKSFLVNILKIAYIRPMINYKYLLIMKNEDKIDVNRTYLKAFKNKLKL